MQSKSYCGCEISSVFLGGKFCLNLVKRYFSEQTFTLSNAICVEVDYANIILMNCFYDFINHIRYSHILPIVKRI